MRSSYLAVHRVGAIAHVELSRPEVRNAFNAELIAEIDEAFQTLGADASVRAVVLRGAGTSFCGGADVAWMRASLELSADDNRADARAMSRMFRTIDRCPKPVVARVHGAAIGGGVGLVAAADIALAMDDTIFGLTEVKLGILPAVISPFVLAKIGRSHARALALTGERFGASRALAIGLVHEIVATSGALERAIERVCAEIATSSPTAIAATKALFAEVVESDYDATLESTSRSIAAQRTSPEGQDGLRSFLEKRTPAWAR